MGFTPQAVRAMSLWQFMAAVDGYCAAHESEEAALRLTEDEEEALFASLDTPPVWMN